MEPSPSRSASSSFARTKAADIAAKLSSETKASEEVRGLEVEAVSKVTSWTVCKASRKSAVLATWTKE